MDAVEVQRVDGVLRIRLPQGVTSQDLVDFLNEEPDRKNLELEYIPETWTSVNSDWND